VTRWAARLLLGTQIIGFWAQATSWRPRDLEGYPGSISRVERQIMSLNIKNAETYQLVQELAALTGETQTTAVTIAVRERLDRVRHLREASLADRLLAIGADTAPRLHEPWRSADHGDLLYDEHGLPA
jgi:antitoxin VapB